MAVTLESDRRRTSEPPVPPEGPPRDGDKWTVFGFVLAATALITALVSVGFAMRAIDESGTSAEPATDKTLPANVDVDLTEFAITPASVAIADGGTLNVVNKGADPHDLTVRGTKRTTGLLGKDESGKVSLAGLDPGAYRLYCSVPGHEDAGMKADLTVGSRAAEPSSAAPEEAKAAAIDFARAPAAGWKPYSADLAPAPGATVHNVTLRATETVMEVAPGVRQEMWTFGGQVPGPTLRGRVGDVFNVTLVNDGKMGHSIDFHASKVAPNVEMRTIKPGESLVYSFRADFAGMWMYHCGTAPALHHIGNGMFGAVVIDPPGVAAVDREFAVIQSELYLGPDGQPGDLSKMQAVAPDAVVFNGYVNQYKNAPINVERGQRIRIWVLDAGPSENSSFHIVGTIFDTVFKEGAYVLRPGARGGAQALDLQPAQGGFVEFTFDHDGTYPMVTHKFANVGKGALGLFQVGSPVESGSH